MYIFPQSDERHLAVTGKRLAKMIKREAKTEKVSLSVAIKELENLQMVQKNAVKVRAYCAVVS